MKQAQINLIEKKLDKRMWSYWYLENLWGNFQANPDPIVLDNIMYSGNTGMMLGLYETVNQDDRYSKPGSLTFRWNEKREFPYDFNSMMQRVAENYRHADTGLMVCEPNWLYNMCNCIGMTALLMHDRLHGTNYYKELFPRTQQSFNEEFLSGDGRCVAIRSSRLGITLPKITSMTSDANFTWYQNALDTGHADRLWTIIRKEFAKIRPDGSLDLTMVGPDTMDLGSYKSGIDMAGCTVLMQTAAEMGDLELWRALRDYIEKKYPAKIENGARRFDVSTTLNVIYAEALFCRPNGWRDIVVRGMPEAWQQGPILADAKYPDVMVTRAVTDGVNLDLVLRPGAGKKLVRLRFERLRPSTQYNVTGVDTTLASSPQGVAEIEINLNDRVELRLAPM